MKVTRQRKDTERRLIITLGRFERSTTKTEILARIRHQKNNLAIGKECGAVVRHEFAKGAYHQLYFISADEFWTPNELVKRQIQADLDAGFLIKTDAGVVPATVAHLPGFIDMISRHMAYVSGEVPVAFSEPVIMGGRMVGKTQAAIDAITKAASIGAAAMSGYREGIEQITSDRPVLFGHCAPQPGTDRESFEEWRLQFMSDRVVEPVPDDLDDDGRSIGSRGKDGFYSPRINTPTGKEASYLLPELPGDLDTRNL